MSDDDAVPSIAEVRARLKLVHQEFGVYPQEDCACTGCDTIRLLDAVDPLLRVAWPMYGKMQQDEIKAWWATLDALLRPASGGDTT